MTTNQVTYSITENKLTLKSGHTVAFDYPIQESLGFEQAIVLLLDVPLGKSLNENVFGVAYDGKIIWRIEEKQLVYEDSPYTGIARKGNKVVLYNWDGLELTVEPATGKIIEEEFSK